MAACSANNDKVASDLRRHKTGLKTFSCLIPVLMVRKTLIKTCWTKMGAYSRKDIQHWMDRIGVPSAPAQVQRDRSGVQRAHIKNVNMGETKHTYGSCYVKCYNYLLLTCSKCWFPHQKWAMNPWWLKRKWTTSWNPACPKKGNCWRPVLWHIMLLTKQETNETPNCKTLNWTATHHFCGSPMS